MLINFLKLGRGRGMLPQENFEIYNLLNNKRWRDEDT